ncbi:hypothetical protein HN836_05160, partial [Candidatus Woesearchaeota archaeon]|nr:hypothetical protein [Candidatus Woesearchaeota archaeon]
MPWRDNYNQIKFDFLLFHNKKININEIISNLNKNSKEYILNCNIKINECENNKLNELFNEKKLITKLKIETIFN